MFSSRTLFIVGAGASAEAGLPIGRQLTASIAEKIDIKYRNYNEQFSGEYQIADALRLHTREIGKPEEFNTYLEACWRIHDAMPQASSIDAFIDHQGDKKIELCGKLAIVRSILRAEKKSRLFVEPDQEKQIPDFTDLQNTWYSKLWDILIADRPKHSIDHIFDNISIIVFNYDRCIEHFLYYSIKNYYGVSSDDAADLIQTLKIYHPYGMVGHLHWKADDNGRPFGANVGGEQLLALAGHIRTFTESVEEEQDISEMHREVAASRNLVFLGFAFHRDNMKLITPPAAGEGKNVFATGIGISESDCEIVERKIKKGFAPKNSFIRVNLRRDRTCCALFDEYHGRLSA